ncbi:MAG: Rrf2 family transcriptional regulator [Bacilli bacterium]|jgi:hypothetical protein|nr:Rrf2 family transcriptional regulator [Staphylococcus sp.]
MKITNRFTIGIHIIVAIEYFKDSNTITSNFLAASTGANPVVIRTVMSMLKDAGLIDISQGKTGIRLAKPIKDISFFSVYKALDCVENDGLFHFHEGPNKNCPIGRNIHNVLDEKLMYVQKAMENQMKSYTIADVYDDIKKLIDNK